MKRLLLVLVASFMLMAAAMSPVDAKATGAEKQPVLREWTDDGVMIEEPSEAIGFTNLVRKPSGLSGTTHVSGLEPGGVYTFWIVAPTTDFNMDLMNFEEVFVALGNSKVVGQNGKATVHWSAATGDPSIVTPVGGIFDDALADPEDRILRIEIAYHGQAPDGGVPDSWLENFWDGQDGVCAPIPFLSAGPIIGPQPHCPVFMASTHVP